MNLPTFLQWKNVTTRFVEVARDARTDSRRYAGTSYLCLDDRNGRWETKYDVPHKGPGVGTLRLISVGENPRGGVCVVFDWEVTKGLYVGNYGTVTYWFRRDEGDETKLSGTGLSEAFGPNGGYFSREEILPFDPTESRAP